MTTDLTVFYIDDDIDDREIFSDAVDSIQEKINLCIYDCADKFIDAVQHAPQTPTLVFIDLNMPGKNGLEVLQELRNSEVHNDVPVVIFSTSNEEQTISKCKALGANFYITKPAAFDDLKRLIEYVIRIKWENLLPSASEFVYKE